MDAARQDLAPVASEPAPAPSESSAIISMIERAARDPNVDIDKMERLLSMQERMSAQQAKSAYVAALSALQIELPVITERGRIEVADKNDRSKIIQSTSFARWDDINDAIRPILRQHGFALSFRNGTAADGKITVTAVLSHKEGHQEETTITLPYDSSGSKNSVQAVGSSLSYGKRYTTIALLNITSRAPQDRDDDGDRGGRPETISDEQIADLSDLIESTNSDRARFCRHMKVAQLSDLPAGKFAEAVAELKRKETRR